MFELIASPQKRLTTALPRTHRSLTVAWAPEAPASAQRDLMRAASRSALSEENAAASLTA